MFGILGVLGVSGAGESGAAVRAWPFYLGIGLWILVVLIHGLYRVRKEGRRDGG